MHGALQCPFCAFQPVQGEYELLLHLETDHSEDSSPFVASSSEIACPLTECGEFISRDELDHHIELHGLENAQDHFASYQNDQPQLATTVTQPAASSPENRTPKRRSGHPTRGPVAQVWQYLFAKPQSKSSHKHSKDTRKPEKANETDNAPSRDTRGREIDSKLSARLGKTELGRFAHEESMPSWLVTMLQQEGQICANGVLSVIERLLLHSPSTEYAYLCDLRTAHVSKLRREGGFCGYRNIQMLISYIIAAQATGHEKFGLDFPSVFQIQDLIENAWDMGINRQGRVETGGIKGTRKYIGTPEAHAVFRSLNIPCWVQAFKDKDKDHANALLYQAIEDYFRAGWSTKGSTTLRLTALAPVYLQHRGHSLTIIGFERLNNGQAQLLVFDPSFRDSRTIKQLIGQTFNPKPSTIERGLEPYRRGRRYFRKFGEFELLYLGSKISAT